MTTAPMNPKAGVSGPGKFAVRTDKIEMGSTAYGEGVETQAIKSGAPLAKTGDVRPARAGDVREAATEAPVTELFAETTRPGEPITAGINRGEGPGASALGMTKITVKLSDSLAAMLPYDTTGEVAVLYQEALAQGN